MKRKIDWKQTLKKLIASAKEDEKIFTEVDQNEWNEVRERKKERRRYISSTIGSGIQ